MKFEKILSLTPIIFMLWGCSTAQTAMTSSKPTPKERLLAYQNADDKSQTELIIIRDHGIAGSACYYAFFIDNVLAARMDVAERASFYLEPGKRSLKITRDPQGKGLCGLGDDAVEKEVSFIPNEKKSFRLYVDLSGQPDIKSYEQ